MHVLGIDAAVDARSRGKTGPDPTVAAGPKGGTRSLGATLFYPHVIDEDLGESYEMTVERSNWGTIRPDQLRLEENHVHTKSVKWV
jgi:hypothetical protein